MLRAVAAEPLLVAWARTSPLKPPGHWLAMAYVAVQVPQLDVGTSVVPPQPVNWAASAL